MDYDYEIEHGYHDQYQELDLYRDVIYVYRTINYARSFAMMAKLFEGCAEIAATVCDTQIDVSYPGELPLILPGGRSYSPGNYQEPELLK